MKKTKIGYISDKEIRQTPKLGEYVEAIHGVGVKTAKLLRECGAKTVKDTFKESVQKCMLTKASKRQLKVLGYVEKKSEPVVMKEDEQKKRSSLEKVREEVQKVKESREVKARELREQLKPIMKDVPSSIMWVDSWIEKFLHSEMTADGVLQTAAQKADEVREKRGERKKKIIDSSLTKETQEFRNLFKSQYSFNYKEGTWLSIKKSDKHDGLIISKDRNFNKREIEFLKGIGIQHPEDRNQLFVSKEQMKKITQLMKQRDFKFTEKYSKDQIIVESELMGLGLDVKSLKYAKEDKWDYDYNALKSKTERMIKKLETEYSDILSNSPSLQTKLEEVKKIKKKVEQREIRKESPLIKEAQELIDAPGVITRYRRKLKQLIEEDDIKGLDFWIPRIKGYAQKEVERREKEKESPTKIPPKKINQKELRERIEEKWIKSARKIGIKTSVPKIQMTSVRTYGMKVRPSDEGAETLRVNNKLFQILYSKNSKVADDYLDWVIYHELGHVQQYQKYGLDQFNYWCRTFPRKLDDESDKLAEKYTGISEDTVQEMIGRYIKEYNEELNPQKDQQPLQGVKKMNTVKEFSQLVREMNQKKGRAITQDEFKEKHPEVSTEEIDDFWFKSLVEGLTYEPQPGKLKYLE